MIDFALHGAAVALAARRTDRLRQVADEITGRSGRTLLIEADLTDKAQAQVAVARTVAELGRLDILVNNAGVMLLGPILDAPLDEWEQMVRVNGLGLLYTAHAVLPHLLGAAESGPRRVADLVNISSVAGRVASSGGGVYSATKFGVVAFSESLRQEVSKRHVRVSVVEPGAVATDLWSHSREEVRQQVNQRFLVSIEPLAAEDIAEAIAFIVTRLRSVAVNELLVRPTEQDWAS